MIMFMFIVLYTVAISDRLLVNLILVEIISILFMVNFMSINLFADNLFVIIFSFFILESVMGLVLLVMLVGQTGYDYSSTTISSY